MGRNHLKVGFEIEIFTQPKHINYDEMTNPIKDLLKEQVPIFIGLSRTY